MAAELGRPPAESDPLTVIQSLGYWDLSGLGLATNLDQRREPGFSPQFSRDSDRLKFQLQLVAELLTEAAQEQRRPGGGPDPGASVRARALKLVISRAKSAREAGDAPQARQCLAAGAIIDYHCGASDISGMVDLAVAAGLSWDLLAMARANSDLVLDGARPGDQPDEAVTLVNALAWDQDILELACGRRLEFDGPDLGIRGELDHDEALRRLDSLDETGLLAVGLSPEIKQREPEVQALAIKTFLADVNLIPFPGVDALDSLAPSIVSLAKVRPDVFDSDLSAEFNRFKRLRARTDMLDGAVIGLWADGHRNLAAKMLTTSRRESETDRLDRAAGESRLLADDRAGAQSAVVEIKDHIRQQRAALLARIGRNFDAFWPREQAGLDREGLIDLIAETLSDFDLDSLPDPELSLSQIVGMTARLARRLEPDELDRVHNLIRADEFAGSRLFDLAGRMQDGRAVELLAGQTTGPAMLTLLCDTPRRFEQVIADKRYLDNPAGVAEMLADDGVVELLARSQGESWLGGLATVFDLGPELAGPKSRELLEAVKLVTLPAITANPSLKHHVQAEIINAPDNNYLAVASRLVDTLSQSRPLWKTLYLFSTYVKGIDPGLDTANIHPISTFPKLERSLANQGQFIDTVDGFRPADWGSLTVDNRWALLDDPDSLTDEELDRFDSSIPFNRLNPEARRQVYAYMLFETVRRTRDAGYKAAADQRNRQLVQIDQAAPIRSGDFIHGTTSDNLTSLLQDGNVAGESRKMQARRDAFPFNVDVSVVEAVSPTPGGTIRQLISDSYGDMGIVYRRDETSWMADQTVVLDRTEMGLHGLILGGIPSTEISAIVFKQPTQLELDAASRAIAENGFYIPIYDGLGELLLSPGEYDRLRGDYNLDAAGPEAILDNALSAGIRLGSNEGSKYFLPTPAGLQEYYIKFGGLEADGESLSGTDHVWTEFLGDEFYRHFGAAVPETKIVQIEGRIGKASRWLANPTAAARLESAGGAEPEVAGLADSFVIDCLTANWDIAANLGNTLTAAGIDWRIDNGNAFDIRSQGGRKPDDLWGGVVAELESGQGTDSLARGMRHMYPDLTADSFAAQVDRLVDRFPDEAIDRLVDSIRRSRADRDSLKQTLKARRDYIVSQRDRIVSELSLAPGGQPLPLAA